MLCQDIFFINRKIYVAYRGPLVGDWLWVKRKIEVVYPNEATWKVRRLGNMISDRVVPAALMLSNSPFTLYNLIGYRK